ncbi:hypothetical protein HTZ97_13830 [Desulfuromonas acetoxidans]|nr:hypothetical protein [Desulfuromonas acetoxidans]MBF0646436.1 hypothetical protein [Desulfuromonas acetoxidans]NVD25517.1 hypothetical protein [Desulfuromonas acetoxidans]NVE17533.1 hypothetical protein [Desulfuromonas acetoxidans]
MFINFLVKMLKFNVHSFRPLSTGNFLNIVITDLREEGVLQKSKSFYTIVEKCIKEEKLVNIIVPLVPNNHSDVNDFYLASFDKYLSSDLFNVVFVEKQSLRLAKLYSLLFICWFFIFSQGTFLTRVNLACLSALNFFKVLNFYAIFDLLPCDNWLGLTGNAELLAFKLRNEIVGKKTRISAVQFGQASMDQFHFEDYHVDTLFVYDEVSAGVYNKLGVDVSSVVVCGSPEFEFYLNAIDDNQLQQQNRINVLFIDQPVFQRSEYSSSYLEEVHGVLFRLLNNTQLNILVKKHPRGSAFRGAPLVFNNKTDDIIELMSISHIVIGFYSNLCDLGLLKNRMVIFLGAESVLPPGKLDWIVSHGGIIVDTVAEVEEIIDTVSIDNICSSSVASCVENHLETSSNVIYSKLVNSYGA